MPTRALRVLITGVNGQVGRALAPVAEAEGFAVLRAPRDALDLTSTASISVFLDRQQPDVIVNCAAYTAVDKAETDSEAAYAVNATGPGHMAQWCAAHDRTLIHLSTDYVFPGTASRPYREDDATGPSSVYGASKLAGEQAVAERCHHHVILRTAWVYAAEGKNFVQTMLRLGQERDVLTVVADQHGCPTSADSIAAALVAVLHKAERDGVTRIAGLYHYVDRGETTWHGFAERIFKGMETRWGRSPTVVPITTNQYPTLARRPAYSVLDTTKFRETFGIVPPRWQDSVDQVLAEMFSDCR